MSELSFDRKYRPKNISEYMGTEIRNIIQTRFRDAKNLPNTILMHGTRGCGKTSLARLLAKEYHCLSRVDGHACGHCEMCQMLDETLIMSEAGVPVMGVTELDIASDSGKAAIDAALDEALLEPMYPLKYKVVIMDEVHMATKQAQNRMLKIFEEPPKHLIFILCTTDPDMLLATLRDRCRLKVHVKKANAEELHERLLYVCKQEGIKTSNEALKILAKSANFNPRDTLIKLEEIFRNFGEVTIETIRKATGAVASEVYMEYYKAVHKGLEDILVFTHSLKERDIEPKEFIKGLTSFTLDCINVKYGIGLDDHPADYIAQVKEFFNIYNAEDLDTLLQIVEYANKMVNDNEAMGELVINTTAMRIGKIKLLSVGLQNEAERAIIENRAGNRKSIEKLKEEERNNTVVATAVDSSLMVATFGANVKEIKSGIKLGVTEEEEKDADNKMMSDDDLFALFGQQ